MKLLPLKVILNPYAGRWKAKAHIEQVKEELSKAGFTFDLVVTQAHGEGIEAARQAAQKGYQTVVAVGGDSTISEVVNGLVQAAGDEQAGTLGIIPLGSANDLADILEIPRQISEACRKLAAGNTRVIDVCQVNDHYFDNNSAVGLEPVVTLEAEKIDRLNGSVRYITAALRAILKGPMWNAHLEWDAGSYQGPVALVSVGNSPRTGGAFYMTPNAKLDDGKFDFVYAPALSRPALLRLLPTTFKGKHIEHKAVVYLQTTHLKITMDSSPLQADGEIIDHAVTQLEYSILPQKLRVIV